MTRYWVLARGGAWRNPKPTGGPYVCEQCRLDACGGNDRTLTMQAVTTIELAPADVCADCGARLLEGREVKERAWHSHPGKSPSPRLAVLRSARAFPRPLSRLAARRC